jgi:deoxyribodipyrimidine photolyase-related protein
MNLVVVLGDQLSEELSSLSRADREQDQIIMAEVAEEAGYVPHHPKKIAFLFAAMRHFARSLERAGHNVHYYDFEETERRNLTSLTDVLSFHLDKNPECDRVVVTECGEWRLAQQIRQWPESLDVPVDVVADDRFFCAHEDFQQWASGRKQLRMEYFYRQLRRRTGLLMNADGEPAGGKWNFDHDNRARYQGDPPASGPMHFKPDPVTEEVLDLVEARFGENFGELRPFRFAVTRGQARRALKHFIRYGLPHFGDFQDAMTGEHDYLFHSILSTYLNAGLLLPREVCDAAEQAWLDGDAPINAVEGFIRQILGWREYVRGIYWLTMPGYREENRLESHAGLPWFYWGGETRMNCVHHAVDATRRNAYAHHIQRLMVTGNLALLLGVDVKAIHEWYLAVYADAYEWVELPNTLGMVMHADGGYLGSKPYAASGKYIHRMSDYCKNCHYNVKTATESDSCPFNSLYWHFIHRHRRRFANNPRMTMIYRSWQRMDEGKRQRILNRAETLLKDPESL